MDIQLVDDHVPEQGESLYIVGTGATGDVVAGGGQDQGIIDDDPKAQPPRIAASGAQRVLARRYVAVTATSNAWGRLSARGTISIPKASAVVRLRAASRKVSAGQRTNLRLGLAGRALAKVRQALATQRRLKARVVVTTTDLARNQASRTVTIRLRR